MDVKLIMFKHNGQRKDFPIGHPVTVIGRGENCDLRIPLLSVSRRQCELHKTAREIKVKDMASSNGTYVNNKRVTESILKAGDRLVVGPIVFTVQIDGTPEEVRPVASDSQQTTESAGEDVVQLEADISAQPGRSGSGSSIALHDSGEEPAVDLDPSSALEALAQTTDKKKPAKK